ncbi:PREDICTED: ecdysone receptor-like [Atta cephalotes]|uniref:Uncharacterized protein n=1 Tax=Atta cephalotes TaxID=12957 RepID=A0A158NQD8_ATTCE|nr:PREDICTED: ecdysone receptor-like [Atta cephalotes]
MDTSADSNMDTDNSGSTSTGIGTIASVNTTSLTLVKAEKADHLIGTSTSPTVTTGPIVTGSNLFTGVANSNKISRSDDWLAADSPESPQNSLPSQNVIYQQQLSEQQQSPMAHSSPLAHQQQQVSNNGYASPMSTSSYDPYSPNGKIERYKNTT